MLPFLQLCIVASLDHEERILFIKVFPFSAQIQNSHIFVQILESRILLKNNKLIATFHELLHK